MKLITRDTDYAIRALCCIAGAREKTLSVRDLTGKLDMQRPFLRKILQKLNKEGLLDSSKGRGGGFTLALAPEKISVYSVMRVFQGPFSISEHLFKGKTCQFIETCFLKKKLDELERIITREMKSITIRSLLKKGPDFTGEV
ncbi:MAG: Rrf2 family transcriptional regulator [Candidatus Omnitrophica bacterium]|nr:Rrf2 family transcriptional regulator [Candidatus Omnitrophota bacterium]